MRRRLLLYQTLFGRMRMIRASRSLCVAIMAQCSVFTNVQELSGWARPLPAYWVEYVLP